jgi:hypothetical protein
MKKEEEVYDYLWIILIVILLLAVGYYINYMTSMLGYTNSEQQQHSQHSQQHHQHKQRWHLEQNGRIDKEGLQMHPPNLVKLYNEDYKVIRNKNDIECVNKDSILLYDHRYTPENDNFDVELMRPYHKNDKFLVELEDVYNTRISSRDAGDIENDEIYDYSLRQQKTDLPLANIPVYALLDDKPLRLSDRKNSEEL